MRASGNKWQGMNKIRPAFVGTNRRSATVYRLPPAVAAKQRNARLADERETTARGAVVLDALPDSQPVHLVTLRVQLALTPLDLAMRLNHLEVGGYVRLEPPLVRLTSAGRIARTAVRR